MNEKLISNFLSFLVPNDQSLYFICENLKCLKEEKFKEYE